MMFDPSAPYNDLPPLPPPIEVETKPVLRKAAAAGRALAELKGVGQTIPNQRMLVISLVLQEARASSEIENIVTTNDALFRAFSSDSTSTDPATKEVLSYREALWAGYEALQTRPMLSTNLFIQIVQTIKKNSAGIRSVPGTAVVNSATGAVIYTPPVGESVIRTKLKELEDYLHGDDETDPLVKMALMHYQFEAIHPFLDGNGRTGRIINILYLVMQGLLDLPVLYLSKSIIDRKSDYYNLLREVTVKEAWEAWTLYMLGAVEETANVTRERILGIRDLITETAAKAKSSLPSRVYSKELIELLFHQPYTKAQFLVDAGLAKRQTAASYLKELEQIGVLAPQKVGREKLYLNKALYDLLAR